MRVLPKTAKPAASLLLGAALLSGCGVSQSSVPIPTQQGAPETSEAKEATEAPIELSLISIKDLPTQLAARKGKVVVLDMWATW